MRIFAITRPGLLAIAISVGALWGCIAAEKVERIRAAQDVQASAGAIRRVHEVRAVVAPLPFLTSI